MAKAGLPEVRKADLLDWKAMLGAVVRRVRGELSLKEFASLIDRDERQVAKWEKGEDRPQFDAMFAVDAFRQPLVVALAELAQDDGIEIVTEIRVRRRA